MRTHINSGFIGMIKPQRAQRTQRKRRERCIIPMSTDLILQNTQRVRLNRRYSNQIDNLIGDAPYKMRRLKTKNLVNSLPVLYSRLTLQDFCQQPLLTFRRFFASQTLANQPDNPFRQISLNLTDSSRIILGNQARN